MGINEIYAEAVRKVYEEGIETSPRGMKVKELLGHTLVSDPNDNIITITGLQTNVDYAREELEWYRSGSNRIDWSPRIQRVWSRYSDDGKTINSNYGTRIFGHYEKAPFNQWEWVKNKLKEDPDSRQALMNINDVFDKETPTKDFPCTVSLQVLLRENKLHWITTMRSNDIFLGYRNDMFCFTELQKQLAAELGVDAGDYIHFASSLHLYEKDFERARTVEKSKIYK